MTPKLESGQAQGKTGFCAPGLELAGLHFFRIVTFTPLRSKFLLTSLPSDPIALVNHGMIFEG